MFSSELADADGEAAEPQVWLDFARDCGYLAVDTSRHLMQRYEETGRMLGGLLATSEKFAA